MRRRFFVDTFNGDRAQMHGDAAHHLGRVLRAEVGQQYELSDGAKVWLAKIERVEEGAIDFVLVEPIEAKQPSVHVTLLLSVVKFDRFEWCLEKATELGVADIVPVDAARSDRALVGA
ncbi:MAG: RsmE family RNA methyltransferase, partial [Acidobacteria bacterium]|nr:RsmE family RNA methyltransferase [Acidobacteriota bacterium]